MGKNIGEKIKFMRKQKDLAQYALAKKAGISQSTLSYIEKGSKTPRFETLRSICKALDTTILELLSVGEDVHPNRFFNEPLVSPQDKTIKPPFPQMSNFERYLYLEYLKEIAQPSSGKRFVSESEI